MKILVIGGGGREHALAWKLSQSKRVKQIFVCPGNGGTQQLDKVQNLDLSASDFKSLVEFAVEKNVDLVVPGPEQPLVDGIESSFRKVGIPVFGPSARAAAMEGSKAFAKDFMARHAIPTAAYKVFNATQIDQAIEFIKTCGFRVVLKASGLAGGKGVLLPTTEEETISNLKDILVGGQFGSAGQEVVIEQFLEGQELSIFAFSDGYTVVPFPAAQDHKRIGDNDTGPNTGGMGAYAPAPVATPEITQRILKEAVEPTIRGMRKEGFPFVGLLFTGIILDATGPKVLEYNVRFGDPETEALLLLLGEDTDLAEVLLACVEHRLDSVNVSFSLGSAVSVVLASEGYPGEYKTGQEIDIAVTDPTVVVFHAGTRISEGKLLSAGGRVLVVSSHASTLKTAVSKVHEAIQQIKFPGSVHRRDIAHRALLPMHATSVHLTYAQSGVSVDAGNKFVDVIKPYVKSTRRPGSDAIIGGFGGTFDLKEAGFQDPVLVSGTDGVGTKLRVACDFGVHNTVGIDLVAMSVNDLIVQGAEPLYFLDYYACSRLHVDLAAEVLCGIAEGCRQAGCALIGGETAEMPGMYNGDDYDLAGFSVGAVERHLLLPRHDIAAGDVLLGIPSSGLHSNGFSLVRKVISVSGLTYTSPCPWSPNITIGAAILKPTRIYVKTLLPAAKQGLLKAMCHITGGGFIDNIPRILPPGLGCTLDATAWPLPPVFKFIIKEGNVTPAEMARTFNNGIGMVLVVAENKVSEVKALLHSLGEETIYDIGLVSSGTGVDIRGLENWSA